MRLRRCEQMGMDWNGKCECRERPVLSLLDHHLVYGAFSLVMCTCPLDCEHRSLKELLMRILFADIFVREAFLCQLLHQQVVSGDKLLFSVVGIKHKSIILRMNQNQSCDKQCGMRMRNCLEHTQSPPNIRLAEYIPTAAIKLGLTLKNLWSNRVTSVRNLPSVRVWIS